MSDQITQVDVEHAINATNAYVWKNIREHTGLSLEQLETDRLTFGAVLGYLLDRVTHGKRASLEMWLNMPLSELTEFLERIEDPEDAVEPASNEDYPKE